MKYVDFLVYIGKHRNDMTSGELWDDVHKKLSDSHDKGLIDIKEWKRIVKKLPVPF